MRSFSFTLFRPKRVIPLDPFRFKRVILVYSFRPLKRVILLYSFGPLRGPSSGELSDGRAVFLGEAEMVPLPPAAPGAMFNHYDFAVFDHCLDDADRARPRDAGFLGDLLVCRMKFAIEIRPVGQGELYE